MSDGFTRVAPIADIKPESSLAVEVDGKPVLVCHSKGSVFAVANLCSHAAEKLECGRVRAGWVACPVHGARFDLATGRAMNPPATAPIAVYRARVADGWVEVSTG